MPLGPKVAADDALARARAVLTHAEDGNLDKGLRDDLLRAAVTMGIAALDTYLHMAVLKSLKPQKLNRALAALQVRLDVLRNMVYEFRGQPNSRPWGSIKKMLHEQLLLKKTFQSYDDVALALKMCGVTDGWSKVAGELGVEKKSLHRKLQELNRRRNAIVHESDHVRASRPQSVKLQPIKPLTVRKYLAWLGRLIEAIDTVYSRAL